jgi:hypothetical protein
MISIIVRITVYTADDILDSIPGWHPRFSRTYPGNAASGDQEVDYALHGDDAENVNVIPEELDSPGSISRLPAAIPLCDPSS